MQLARVQAKWPNQVTLMLPVNYFCHEQCPIIRNATGSIKMLGILRSRWPDISGIELRPFLEL
jgi:hypothetical protein